MTINLRILGLEVVTNFRGDISLSLYVALIIGLFKLCPVKIFAKFHEHHDMFGFGYGLS